MFGLTKVPTMAYRPITAMSIGSGGSVLFYSNRYKFMESLVD